jgi:hypothetical protein
MSGMLATGTLPIRPEPGRIDFTPLITVIMALLFVRLVLGLRLTWQVVVAVVVLGTALSWAIEAWGVLVPTAVTLVAATILTAPLHRGDDGGSASSA